MPRSLPISLNIMPDEELEEIDSARLVLNAYSLAMAMSRHEPKAFEAAIRAWRECNPQAAQGADARAVASIICKRD
jgi:hypothetical protein